MTTTSTRGIVLIRFHVCGFPQDINLIESFSLVRDEMKMSLNFNDYLLMKEFLTIAYFFTINRQIYYPVNTIQRQFVQWWGG